jgi:hypothetical protein
MKRPYPHLPISGTCEGEAFFMPQAASFKPQAASLKNLEPWNPGTLEHWNFGILEPRNPRPHTMKKLCFLIAVFLFGTALSLIAQNVGINNDGSAPHPSAGLEVKYGDKGVLIPRVSPGANFVSRTCDISCVKFTGVQHRNQ